jgi:hypothetical protein
LKLTKQKIQEKIKVSKQKIKNGKRNIGIEATQGKQKKEKRVAESHQYRKGQIDLSGELGIIVNFNNQMVP